MAAPARNAVIAGALFVALFIGSIAIVLLANLEFGDNEAEELAWWKKTLIYHVYVPSFKDSNGDGMGDLKGKLAHCVKGNIFSPKIHGVWKSQKKSYSTLPAKQATFTFWVDQR